MESSSILWISESTSLSSRSLVGPLQIESLLEFRQKVWFVGANHSLASAIPH